MKIGLKKVDYLIKGTLLFFIYFSTARIGLAVGAISGFATLIWLPTGLSISLLFLLGRGYWPFILLAAYLVNYFNGAAVPVALAIGIGNCLEALVAAYILRRFVGLRPNFNRLNEVSAFIVVILICTMISSTIGTTSLLLGKVIHASSYSITWFAWWTGDVISGLLITPFILTWSTPYKISINLKKLLETGFIVLLLSIILWAIFIRLPSSPTRPLTYLAFPPLVWVALRYSSRIAVSILVGFSIFTVWITTKCYGPFTGKELGENLLYLQSFMVVVDATILVLSSAVNERKLFERRKDEFISIASHELKTPLASIKIFAQMLQRQFEKKGDKKYSTQLERINLQIDKVTNLALDLLDIRRLQEDKIILHKKIFEINHLIDDVLESFPKTAKRRIIIKKYHDIMLFADRDRIAQVITNFLSNALKYSPRNKKVIIRVLQNDRELILSVEDFGIGVPFKEQERIFDRFYKVGSNEIKGDASSGFGLYIAKGIIIKHGGKIWVKSPSDRSSSKKMPGSTFYFSIPVVEP